MAYLYDLLHGDKRRKPLPPKKKEELPFMREGISYKEWHDRAKGRHTWRNRRWMFLIFINILFVISFTFDLGILEGSLSGSRLLGLYLMDPFNSLQELTIAGTHNYIPHLTTNFWTGFLTILVFYWIVGGRAFCSWVCPYHFFAELGEKVHDYWIKKRKIKEKTYDITVKYVFWIGFILLALLTGELVFENLNPVGILSRAIIYGPGLALLWVILLLSYEVFGVKRFWCRYVCPIGVTYSFVGDLSPINIKFELDKCGHCRDCQDVCLVPHELWFVKRGAATREVHYTGGDCTKCGLCIDVCPGNALSYGIRDSDKIFGK
ncbi:MAG: NapH/MauN family ferredoxin-type protein [Chlorobi bacterium]|nr:NapH/MauN family ferredoxin-type protein [Chlorobiota bacterium]